MTVVSVVFDIESDPPRPIGAFIRQDEDVVVYLTSGNRFANAPADCVTVVDVDPIASNRTEPGPLPGGGLITDDDAIETLRRNSSPVPGRDGVRVDREGRQWYSARWLGAA